MRIPVVLVALLAALAAVPTTAALPTPGLFCDPSEAVLGRMFPEAMETNDFVSYDEAVCGLEALDAEYGDLMRIDLVAKSVGWPSLTGGHDQYDVFVVRVTNELAELPAEDKIRIVFQLSIHGNEKGGREGGLRVIEDLVRGIGFADEHPELIAYLDYMELLFVFPNPDGWTHEEFEHRHADACYFSLTCDPGSPGVETQNFVRVNGNGKDVNRQWPTVGWQRAAYEAMGQPEAIGLVGYLKNETNIRYASDIHGMLAPADGTTPAVQCAPFFGFPPEDPSGLDPTCFANAVTGAKGHFVLTMLPAGRQSPHEMILSTSLAELVKERLNENPYYAEWNNLPSLQGAWGGEFNDWGTVWDTIGYTDSGFTSDFYAQDIGLNAPGVDFELSYNHITFDNYYPGAAQRMNAYHVENVRDIVRAFMDQANLDVGLRIETQGTRTAFIENPTVVTNAGNLAVEGWPKENPHDDAFDLGHREFTAAPNDYFTEMQPLVAAGDQPGVFDAITVAQIANGRLSNYDNLVIAGSAAKLFRGAEGPVPAVANLKAWVEAGGNLVLTDEAMNLLWPLGVVADAGDVDVLMAYAGATNFVDMQHDLVKDVRGLARQTYEPVPLGFSLEGLNAPVWYVKADAFDGEVVGLAGEGQGANPNPGKVNFGRAALGSGTVSFLGALLPDPTLETGAAPYGVDAYATTYTGNQLLRNMLGWDVVFAGTPLEPAALGTLRSEPGVVAGATDGDARVPAPGIALVVALAAALAVSRKRRS